MLLPHELLNQYFGYADFRYPQREAIAAALAGDDCLVLMPTGGGKSICFQIVALSQQGLTLVISPLIALMEDQVAQLKKRGIKAEALHSGLQPYAIDRILDNCVHGEVKLLYVAPERLTTPLLLERLRRLELQLIAIDEAHCISQWGYDFRPAYLNIIALREQFPQVPAMALTATATPEVVADIRLRLGFAAQAPTFSASFERKNLSFFVLEEQNKTQRMLDILRKTTGTGIVYTRSRALTEKLADQLEQADISAAAYHAGMSAELRRQTQEDWMQERIEIIVATTAFGMGIDKPNVRQVIHYDLPENLEAYFQEAGRAGRDGNPSFCTLLFHNQDKQLIEDRLNARFPPFEFVRRVYDALCSSFNLAFGSGQGEAFPFDLPAFSRKFLLKPNEVHNAIKLLEQEDYVVWNEAASLPASLQFRVGREELYDFQLKNSVADGLLKHLLRNHGAAFQESIRLKMSSLAKTLQKSEADLHKLLTWMQAQGVIRYQPAVELPLLTFSRERIPSANLLLDTERFRFRKKTETARTKAMLNYLSEERCRQEQLLAYFGESSSDTCGKCDVCRRAAPAFREQYSPERLSQQILARLADNAMTSEEIASEYSVLIKRNIVQTLQQLADAERIDCGSNGRWRIWGKA